jgi:hypothetical protein
VGGELVRRPRRFEALDEIARRHDLDATRVRPASSRSRPASSC